MRGDTERIPEIYGLFRIHSVVCTDSRNITPGCIFFALRGPSFNGNGYALQALEKGAAYAVVDDPAVIPDGADAGRFILVDDTLRTLQKLAAHHRRELGVKILAITGTNGKTTTKELITAVLSEKYKVSATKGNLNNHIGVPLTLLAMDGDTEIGIVEMGASGRGEIELLCQIAAPDAGIITNIGRAHLEGFGGVEGVEKAKGELYDYLAASEGTALVRQDDPTLSRMAGQRQGLDILPYDSQWADGFSSKLSGAYNIYNIAAAVAAGKYYAVDRENIRIAVSEYTPQNNRSQLIETDRNTVVADCYNANPSSMEAAINNMLSCERCERGKVVLILGDMLELGEWSDAEHAKILRKALVGNPNALLLAGGNFSKALTTLQNSASPPPLDTTVMTFADAPALASYLTSNPVTDSYVLLKGSRGMALENLLRLL